MDDIVWAVLLYSFGAILVNLGSNVVKYGHNLADAAKAVWTAHPRYSPTTALDSPMVRTHEQLLCGRERGARGGGTAQSWVVRQSTLARILKPRTKCKTQRKTLQSQVVHSIMLSP